MTRRTGYRLLGMRSREENRQSIQGFNATEEVIPTSAFGSPSDCHPELVSGSGFDLISAQRVFVLKRSAALMDTVTPYFRSHLLVSEANVSDVLFLGFLQRSAGFRF